MTPYPTSLRPGRSLPTMTGIPTDSAWRAPCFDDTRSPPTCMNTSRGALWANG
jgi:hypothetical protein